MALQDKAKTTTILLTEQPYRNTHGNLTVEGHQSLSNATFYPNQQSDQ